jgi:hypothetical protein
MRGWKEDKRWSDKFLPEIKQILGLYLIGEPPIEEDSERNTDLIVLKMEAVRIACRIRRYEYFSKYPNEITIREGRPSGTKTELTKIIEGWGDYFFYGFSDESEENLVLWRLCDLKAFRIWLMRYLCEFKKLPGIPKNNIDNSSSFRAFDADIIPNFIIRAATL